MKNPGYIIGLVALSVLLTTGCGAKVTNNHDALAQHLALAGFKVFGTERCGACSVQKELFGDSWQYINYEECTEEGTSHQTELCKAENIVAYPTWELPDGTREKGVITPEELAEISNFSE